MIVNAYATAAVSGVGSSFYLGGLVGRQDNGSIVNAYAVGAVSGSTDVGGLVGEQNGGSIANAYATGAVSGRFDAGGLVGAAFGGSIANTFWDAGATGQQVGAGFGAIGGATGVTTAQLHSLATLAAAGWSIDGQGGTASVWRIYDGQTAPLLRSFLQPLDISGLAATAAYNGQAQATAGPAVTLLGAAAIGVHAGTYTSSYYSTQQGYDLIGQAELTITPAMLTASLVGSTSKTYDGTTAATLSGANFQLAGVIGQDAVALITPTSGSFDAVHVGAGKTVSASGLALANNAFGDYQLAATGVSAAIGTITQATLTASLIGTSSKTYDGTTTATLNGANFRLAGVAGSDTVALTTPTIGSFDTIHVGNGKTVSAVGLTLANNSFGDYQLAATGVSAAIGTITQATLTASLIGSTSKTYDGITTATLSGANFKLMGVIGQDTVGLATPNTGTFDTIHVGNGKTVSAVGLTLANNSFGDYQLAATGVSASIGAITPATLTASLIGSTSKTYDGTTKATLTSANFKLAGVIGQDAVALTTPSAGSFDTVHVGTGKTVSAAGLTLANNAFGDYRLAAGGVSAAIGAITPATLTASLIGATSKTYDGTTTATLTSANFKLAGVIGQDAVALTTPSTGSFDTANAGSGKTVTANGLGLGNNAFGDYRLASTTIGGAMGRIDPRALSVSLTGSVNKVYDGTTVATLGGGNFTLTGVLGADNVTVATTNGTYATANVAYAIPVAVSGLQLGGAASKNYALNTTSLSAAIGTISPFILRATLLSLPADALRWAQLSLQAPGDYGLTLASPLGDLAIIAPPINKYASR